MLSLLAERNCRGTFVYVVVAWRYRAVKLFGDRFRLRLCRLVNVRVPCVLADGWRTCPVMCRIGRRGKCRFRLLDNPWFVLVCLLNRLAVFVNV